MSVNHLLGPILVLFGNAVADVVVVVILLHDVVVMFIEVVYPRKLIGRYQPQNKKNYPTC